MASRDDEAMLCIVEEERRSHRRSRPARVPRYFQSTALVALRINAILFHLLSLPHTPAILAGGTIREIVPESI